MEKLSHLFSPVIIGDMTVKNRLLMSAMSINFGVDDRGRVTDQLTRYLERRAEGGVGMMLVGGGNVHPAGMELPDLPRLWEEDCVPALKTMVDIVKQHDVRLGMQIMHGGRQCYLPEKVAPSPIPAPAVVKGKVRALEIPEIAETVACFGDAAARCRNAGFDFIELHAAHGYLINQFMAPNANIREDAYGGSFENRTRFLFEIMADIRQKTGPDFPVGVRINGDDFMANGCTLEDALRLAPMLEAAGAAYIHVSAGVYGSRKLTIPPMYEEHGCFVHLARAVKPVVSIPVVAVGRIKDPKFAERILQQNDADIVAMGRPLLADPDLPLKAREGRFDEIRPCLGCCLGCIHAVLAREPGSCVVNPDVGREFVKKEKAAPEKRRVLVAGAGPAGLACGRSLALKGHEVVICEKNDTPGGLLSLVSKAPGRSELTDILAFFLKELERLDVEIRYNTPLTAAVLKTDTFDDVVLATGSLPDMPVIKGLFHSEMDVFTCVEILEGTAAAGIRVLVLGGGTAGLVTADFLAEQGKEAVVLNRKNRFAEDLSSNDRYYLRENLNQKGVRLFKAVGVKRFTPDGAEITVKGNPTVLDGFDTVVIAEKMSPIRDAWKLRKHTGAAFHFIGDAKSPRHLMFCISEAQELADAL